MKIVGIIDLGSNSVRVSVECFSENLHNTIFMDKKTVKLSENMNIDMLLKPEAIERTINTLKEYKKTFETIGVDRIVAVATAAVRKAKNGEDFLEKVREETGISIDVIDGRREAEFDYLGLKNSLNITDCIIMDIGGGSTEIIGIRSGELCDFVSIPFASRNITEIFLSPETTYSITKAEEKVFEIFDNIEWLKKYKNFPIIGLGGCLRAIGKADARNKNIDYISGHTVDIKFIKELYEEIKGMSVINRIEVIGKSKGDIILGGAMPLMSVIRIINPKYMFVSDKGVRDGIINAISMNLI